MLIVEALALLLFAIVALAVIVGISASPLIAAIVVLSRQRGRRPWLRWTVALICLCVVETGPGFYAHWRLSSFEATARDVHSGRGPKPRTIQIPQVFSEAEDKEHFDGSGWTSPSRKEQPFCGPLCLELLYEEGLDSVVVETRPLPPTSLGRMPARYIRFWRERRTSCPNSLSLDKTYSTSLAMWLAAGDCLMQERVDQPHVDAVVSASDETVGRWNDEFGCGTGVSLWAIEPNYTAQIAIIETFAGKPRVVEVRNTFTALVASIPFVLWPSSCNSYSGQWLAPIELLGPRLDVKAVLRERYGFSLTGQIPESPPSPGLRGRVMSILSAPTGITLPGTDSHFVRLQIEALLSQDRLKPADIDLLRKAVGDDAFTEPVPHLERFPDEAAFYQTLTGDILARVLRTKERLRWASGDTDFFTYNLAYGLTDAPAAVLRQHDREIRAVMKDPERIPYLTNLVSRLPEFEADPREALGDALLSKDIFAEPKAARLLCRLASPDDKVVRKTFTAYLVTAKGSEYPWFEIVGLIRAGGRDEAEALAKRADPRVASLISQTLRRFSAMPQPDDC